MTMRGYEWITYNMYDYDTNLLTDRIRFSLEFKVMLCDFNVIAQIMQSLKY